MVAQKRVAIYARVSTVDKGQDPETQLLGLRYYAARREFVVVGEYVDYASGTREDRPQYQALFAAARRRQLDVVLVVTVQVVKTGITPPLATSGRFWGAEMERLHRA